MILLRNLLLAVGAFVVTGYGFYAWLVHQLPPDQVQPGYAVADVGGQSGTIIRRQPESGSVLNATPSSVQPSGAASTKATPATPVPGETNDTTIAQAEASPAADKSSGFALFMAVVDDFIAASQQGAEAEAVREQAAFEARYRVPDWLDERFDHHAARAGKTLSGTEKAALLATLLELRQMKLDRMGDQAVSSLQAGELNLLSDWSLTSRALQAELQFRNTLNTGLAEFMKSLSTDELQRLLVLPLDQSTTSGQTAEASPTHQATALTSTVLR